MGRVWDLAGRQAATGWQCAGLLSDTHWLCTAVARGICGHFCSSAAPLACLAHVRLPRLQAGAVGELLPQIGGGEHTLFPIHSVALLSNSCRAAAARLPLALSHLQLGQGRRRQDGSRAGPCGVGQGRLAGRRGTARGRTCTTIRNLNFPACQRCW